MKVLGIEFTEHQLGDVCHHRGMMSDVKEISFYSTILNNGRKIYYCKKYYESYISKDYDNPEGAVIQFISELINLYQKDVVLFKQDVEKALENLKSHEGMLVKLNSTVNSIPELQSALNIKDILE